MGKPLSFDAIFTALAVLSVDMMSIGCSKTESAAPTPETNATTPAATTTAWPGAANPSAPTAPAAAAPTPEGSKTAGDVAAVDAGREAAPSKKKASASCGATGCSPDMKKNGK